MLLGRLFSYPDTHRHRIGTNYLQLPINQPKVPVHSYSKDGAMRYRNPGDPVYAPNSYGGPKADPERYGEKWNYHVAADLVRTAHSLHREDDDWGQPRTLWEKVLSDTDRDHLVSNIVAHASNRVEKDVQDRVVEYWTNVHPDLGGRVGAGLRGG
jgi:catalase